MKCEDITCEGNGNSVDLYLHREPLELEILNMQIGINPRILAVLVGHNYIHNSSLSLYLYIYQKVK
jgi:hypothetical protein